MLPSEYYEKCNLKNNPLKQNASNTADERAAVWVGYDDINKAD